MLPHMHVCDRPLPAWLYTLRHSSLRADALAVAAVPELSVFSDLEFAGVGGGDAVAGLHAVSLLQLGQSAH